MLKRVLILCFIVCFMLLTACQNEDDALFDITTQYNEIPFFTTNAEITSNLGTNVLVYGVEFTYNKDAEDILVINSPDEISDISVKISKDDSGSVVEFGKTSLETAMPDIYGFTPVDVISALIDDIKTLHSEIVSQHKEDDKTIIYTRFIGENDYGEYIKDIYFDEEFQLINAEIYLNGQMLLDIQFENFTFLENTN